MSYHCPQLDGADQLLREAVLSGFPNMFSKEMEDVAKEKVLAELEVIENQLSAPSYMVLYNALKSSGAQTDDFCFRGTAASSIVLFSLGLTNVNPLDSEIRLYSEFFYDITGTKAPSFELNVSENLHKRIFEYFDNYPGNDHIEKKYDDHNQLIGVYVGDLSEDYTRGEPYYDTFFINFIPVNDPEGLGKGLMNDNIISLCKPKNLREYVKCYGFKHSTGAWEDNAEKIINEGIPFDELIADREDVYEYMLKSGMERNTAFYIAESVRKGKIHRNGWSKEMADALDKYKIPEWYRESCQRIRYLFPRAHAISFIKCYCKGIV